MSSVERLPASITICIIKAIFYKLQPLFLVFGTLFVGWGGGGGNGGWGWGWGWGGEGGGGGGGGLGRVTFVILHDYIRQVVYIRPCAVIH